MKNIIKCFIATLVILTQLPVWANSPNAILSVSANSGLNLRTTPGPYGQIIKKLYVGDKVTIVHDELGLGYADRIEWVDGEWIQVEHEGDIGYVFDGFLTALPIPDEIDEFSCMDLDLTTPIANYFQNNFKCEAAPDTILGSNKVVIRKKSVEGHVFRVNDTFYDYKVEMDLVDTEVMKAYHILYNMLSSKPEQISFIKKSTFIEDEMGKIRRVEIDVENPIFITQNDSITSIRVIYSKGGCSL